MPRIRQLLTFLGIFALILASSHFYMFERINYYLQLSSGEKIYAGLFLGLAALLTLAALPLTRLLPRKLASILSWIVYPWMGIALLMFITFLATDTVWILLNVVKFSHPPQPGDLLQRCFGGVALAVTGTLSVLAMWNGLRPVTVKPLTVALKKLPKAFDGLRLAQITDLHIGPLIDGHWLQKVVDKVNELTPDIVVITGDLVDGSVDELRRHVAPLSGIKAPRSIYFITGNHEYYSGVRQWCDHLTGMGIRVLRNERVSILSADKEHSFDLAGVDDWASGHFPGEGPDLPKALAGRDTGKALILLAHQPAAIAEAAAHGVDLQLSGHTHGGQIWPFTYLVYLQQPYSQGLYRYPGTDTQIYVSAGTGFWGPPMRLGTRAEITCITLRSV